MPLLRHLALRCRDMEKSREFYEKLIGWKFVGYRPSGAGLDLTDGTNNITLLQQPDDCKRPGQEEGNEYIHFGVIVDDLAACQKRLEEWGAEFSRDNIKLRREFKEGTVATKSFKVLDPDGNVVDVTANTKEWRGIQVDQGA